MAATLAVSPAHLARLIANLTNNRPEAGAPNSVLAAWHEEKAMVLELRAVHEPALAAIHTQRAGIAREMAAELRRAGDR
ncbi:hypothetical protein [Crossiella sp. CA198]|uniref:hypothetical protein n=1 Tax=Crossiella sp. CA198 TaxID=3455607 RepID=UPI003F8D1026